MIWQTMWNAIVFSMQVTMPNVLLLMFGMWLRHIKQVDEHFCDQASKLVFNWALPILLFLSILKSNADYEQQVQLVLAGVVVTFILYFGSNWVAKRFVSQPANRGVFVQGVFRANTAIIGLAFCANAYGPKGLAIGALYAGAMTILFNILGVITLSQSLQPGLRMKWGATIKQIVKNPLIIGIVAGLIYKNSIGTLPITFLQTGQFLADISLPVALICAGATFDLKSMFKTSDISIWASFGRLIIAPVVTIIVGKLWGLPTMEFGVLFMMSASPVAAASYVMVRNMGGNATAAANILGMTTFVGMFVAAISFALLYSIGWL